MGKYISEHPPIETSNRIKNYIEEINWREITCNAQLN
jgi:hypothetical protein